MPDHASAPVLLGDKLGAAVRGHHNGRFHGDELAALPGNADLTLQQAKRRPTDGRLGLVGLVEHEQGPGQGFGRLQLPCAIGGLIAPAPKRPFGLGGKRAHVEGRLEPEKSAGALAEQALTAPGVTDEDEARPSRPLRFVKVPAGDDGIDDEAEGRSVRRRREQSDGPVEVGDGPARPGSSLGPVRLAHPITAGVGGTYAPALTLAGGETARHEGDDGSLAGTGRARKHAVKLARREPSTSGVDQASQDKIGHRIGHTHRRIIPGDHHCRRPIAHRRPVLQGVAVCVCLVGLLAALRLGVFVVAMSTFSRGQAGPGSGSPDSGSGSGASRAVRISASRSAASAARTGIGMAGG